MKEPVVLVNVAIAPRRTGGRVTWSPLARLAEGAGVPFTLDLSSRQRWALALGSTCLMVHVQVPERSDGDA